MKYILCWPRKQCQYFIASRSFATGDVAEMSSTLDWLDAIFPPFASLRFLHDADKLVFRCHEFLNE